MAKTSVLSPVYRCDLPGHYNWTSDVVDCPWCRLHERDTRIAALEGAAGAVGRGYERIARLQSKLDEANREKTETLDLASRGCGAAHKCLREKEALQSRLEECHTAMQRVMARLADLLDADQFNNIEAIVLDAGVPFPPDEKRVVETSDRAEVARCGASCPPQIPRMGLYGICQLPAGHEGEHNSSVVERQGKPSDWPDDFDPRTDGDGLGVHNRE